MGAVPERRALRLPAPLTAAPVELVTLTRSSRFLARRLEELDG